MTAMATTAVTNDSNGSWCMVQHFRAHVCHTHGAERTRTYRAHTRVHVHIPCTYTPSACISDFDAFLKISFGLNFVFSRPGPKVILRICFGKRCFWEVYGFNWRPKLCKFTGVWPRGVGFIHLKLRRWASGAPGGCTVDFFNSPGV